MEQRIKLWDLPTRLFHWLLVILVTAAIVTGKVGGSAIEWHGRIGLAILGLIAFRLAWGILGSTYARFTTFFPSPASLRAYLRGEWQGVGHNPLGAFSVFALLGLISLQVVTGLLGNDDIAFNGPLQSLVSKAWSDRLTWVHHLAVNVLFALIAMHLAAILFHAHVKKDNLVRPMLTGWKEIKAGQGKSASGGRLPALVFALLVALAAVYGGSGTWIKATAQTEPPPAAAW